jgi:hypothetical protein
MKVLIVFLGLLLICCGFVFYQSDMGRYVRAQTALKALAEECAAGAALYFDDEAYALGKMIFDEGEGRKYIEHALESAVLPEVDPTGGILCESDFYDDRGAYGQEIDGATVRCPSVVVRLSVSTEDLFRLPFLSVTKLERRAMYELPDRARG